MPKTKSSKTWDSQKDLGSRGKVVRACHQHCVHSQRVAAAAQRRLDRVEERARRVAHLGVRPRRVGEVLRVEVVTAPRLQVSVLLGRILIGLGATAALIGIIYRLMCVLDQHKQTYRAYTPADAGDIEVDTMLGPAVPAAGEAEAFVEQSGQRYGGGGAHRDGASTSDSDDASDFRDAEVEEPV